VEEGGGINMELMKNAGYFLKEARTIIRLNRLTYFVSVLSTGLIFFMLAVSICLWWAGGEVMEAVRGEAEINIYYYFDNQTVDPKDILTAIKAVDGVHHAKLVSEEDAYARMVNILGKDAEVLSHFDENPFTPFIEANINFEDMDAIVQKVSAVQGVESVRDNKDVLGRLHGIMEMLELMGYLIVAATGIITLVIISHIIRMGIYDSRDHINTLRLLGAPESFIGFPYLLSGLFVTFCGAILGAAITSFAIHTIYQYVAGPLPFIPLPPRSSMLSAALALIFSAGAALGISGSIFGLLTSRK
jgi:cell division transport system permease protein